MSYQLVSRNQRRRSAPAKKPLPRVVVMPLLARSFFPATWDVFNSRFGTTQEFLSEYLWHRWQLANRGDGHTGESRRPSSGTPPIPGTDRRHRALGEPADPQCGDVGGQSVAATALLVFPGNGISLLAKGWRALFRDLWREPVSRHLQQHAVCLHSSIDGGDGAHGAGR